MQSLGEYCKIDSNWTISTIIQKEYKNISSKTEREKLGRILCEGEALNVFFVFVFNKTEHI